MRAAGILTHISSLPSPYGIGTLGKAAYEFADFLHAAGQRYWQILPVGPTGCGDSPYQSFSAFAGNPYFIDLDFLVGQGLLSRADLQAVTWAQTPQSVDYGALWRARLPLLRRAYQAGRARDAQAVSAFLAQNAWVDDYALFMAIKQHQNERSWALWPQALRLRKRSALARCREQYRDDIDFYGYLQYLFYQQWDALRAYLRKLDIRLIGDVPMYVPYDSADVWQNPDLFLLDASCNPTVVAGCPPDGFSADGQLWGNPIYDWAAHEKTGFLWWRERLKKASELFDVIRFDHFRGFESYWEIPAAERSAANGQWVQGPGVQLIDAIKQALPDTSFIAEDLGYLTPAVDALVRHSGFPGMKVLEFAFDAREAGNYLPEYYPENCVCYTGTHDNPPLREWMLQQDGIPAQQACAYLKATPEKLPLAMLECGLNSRAKLFVAQLQDYLSLGAGSRMNVPGTLGANNWRWRFTSAQLTPSLAAQLRRLCKAAGRLHSYER